MSVFSQPIARTILSSSTSSITLNNIPQGYTDLKVEISAQSTYAAVQDTLYIQFNGDTASNYNQVWAIGLGNFSSASPGFSNNATYFYWNIDASTSAAFCLAELYIPSYANTSVLKSSSMNIVNEYNNTGIAMYQTGNLWNSTTAITSIKLSLASGSLAANSSITLYGILKQGI